MIVHVILLRGVEVCQNLLCGLNAGAQVGVIIVVVLLLGDILRLEGLQAVYGQPGIFCLISLHSTCKHPGSDFRKQGLIAEMGG